MKSFLVPRARIREIERIASNAAKKFDSARFHERNGITFSVCISV